MGFRRQPLKIDFPVGHELHGLEVWLRRLSIGQLADVAVMAGAADATEDGALRMLVERLSKAIVSWNLEDDGGCPVGTTIADIEGQDFTLILSLVQRWMDVADVPAPLEQRSTAGVPFQVPSIPMETLSSSPPNSFTPS